MSETSEVDMEQLREAVACLKVKPLSCSQAFHFMPVLLAAADALLRRGESRPATVNATCSDAIDLFLEYRDQHGYDEARAKDRACLDMSDPDSSTGGRGWLGGVLEEAARAEESLPSWARPVFSAPAAHEGDFKPCGRCRSPRTCKSLGCASEDTSRARTGSSRLGDLLAAPAPDAAREGISERTRQHATMALYRLDALTPWDDLEVTERAAIVVCVRRMLAARPAPQAKRK